MQYSARRGRLAENGDSLAGRTQGRGYARVSPRRSSPVEVQVIGTDSLNILYARDISVLGLGIYVPHRFQGCDIHSEVQLVITLPGRNSFLAQGVIRHATEGNEASEYFGVEFTRIKPRHQAYVRQYVEELLTQENGQPPDRG